MESIEPMSTMTRYDLTYFLSLPLVLPYIFWRHYARGKYAESVGGMRGKFLPTNDAARVFKNGSLWVHAVSVGEVAAARAVAPGLRRLIPQLPLVVSTITETGQASARHFFAKDTVTYFPLDFSNNVRRFQEAFRPRVFIMMETELWPNFLIQAAARGTRCFMVNAKLSDRSFPRYSRFKNFMRPALEALSGVCAQTEVDAERFAALGIDPLRIRVTGNCKFDLEQRPLGEDEKQELARAFGMNLKRRWIVAGSTHPGEENLILESYRAVCQVFPDAGLLLCPRHPERFEEVARLVVAAGFRVGQAGAPDPAADPEVVILDRMGVLAKSYGLGEAAIVAGSFCPVGGHNLLEAAAHGVPVLFGPDMHSQREIDRLFKEAKVGQQVTPEGLGPALIGLLQDNCLRRRQGAEVYQVIERNRGSAGKAAQSISEWLSPDRNDLKTG
jgi:3-deoxy-D-manno-octulosonic-acid transferase